MGHTASAPVRQPPEPPPESDNLQPAAAAPSLAKRPQAWVTRVDFVAQLERAQKTIALIMSALERGDIPNARTLLDIHRIVVADLARAARHQQDEPR